MNPDDPRHGTYAGAVAHYATKSPLCDPCREAKRTYARRHSKEAKLGRPRLVDADMLRRHVKALVREGMTRSDIARAAGVDHETVRFILGGARQVNVKTFRALAAVTPSGQSETFMRRDLAARKIRALAAIGHPLKFIAAELGMRPQALANIIHDYRPHQNRVTRETWDAVSALYDRLHMTPGPSNATRNIAAKRGWPVPLAYEDIEDPTEQPADWQYVADNRADQLRDLADMNAGVTEACRRLKISRAALEKWCARNGLSDVYRQMAAREALGENQHMREGAA